MQPGDRKRSAPSQRHACCDTQEESVDATNHKSVRLDSSLDNIVYEQDTASNPSRINIISLGDHDISPSHMDNDHNVQADSVCNTHSFEQPQRIQDTNSQMVTAPHVNNPEELRSDINVQTRKTRATRSKTAKKLSVKTKQAAYAKLGHNTPITEQLAGQQYTQSSPSVIQKHINTRTSTATSSKEQVPSVPANMTLPTQVPAYGLSSEDSVLVSGHTARQKPKRARHLQLRSNEMDNPLNTEQQQTLTQQNIAPVPQLGGPINPYQQILAPGGNPYTVQAPQQYVQQLQPDVSSDETSSSDDDGVLNQIGTQHVQMINTMPTEGISLNSMHFQYAEPISTAISCQIPNKIKKRIWRNQFIDLAVLLPRTYASNNSPNFQLQLSSKAQISLVPNQTRKIFHIESWTSAFLRFIAIYTERFPMEAPQLIKYTEIVRDLARRSTGQSWYLYDQQFRMLRETVQIPWGRLHTEFWVMASNSPSQKPFRNNFRQTRSTQFNPSARNRKFHEYTCWAYNRRGICGERSCKFQHRCGLCKGSHPATNCTAQTRSPTQYTGSQNNYRPTVTPNNTTTSRTNNTQPRS